MADRSFTFDPEEIKRLREDLEELTKRVEDLEKRPEGKEETRS